MKSLKSLGTCWAAVFIIFSGASLARAQDQANPPADAAGNTSAAAPAEAAPKVSTRQELKALEEKNAELERRLDALEGKASSNAGTGEAANMDLVGPSNGGSSTGSMANGIIFEGETLTNANGAKEVVTPFNLGNEYLNSDIRHFVFSDPTGNIVFRIGGYSESQFDYFFQPVGDYLLDDYVKEVSGPAGDVAVPAQKDFNGFLARKEHLDFGAYFNKMFGASIAIENDSSDTLELTFYHAYVFAKIAPWLVITAGKFTDPLSLENVQPSQTLAFEEPSMVQDLAVQKDVGIMASGEFGHFGDYALVVSNGSQDGESTDATGGKPEQNGKAITGRVFMTPFLTSQDEWLKGLGFGVGWAIDNETYAISLGGSDISPAQNVPWPNGMTTSMGGNEFAYDSVSFFADGPFYHWDPQFYWFAGPIGLQGEYIQSIQTVVSPGAVAPVQLTQTAWMLEGYFDMGGEPNFDSPKIDHPFNFEKGYWGDLEFVARVHQVLLDPKSFTVNQPYDNQTTPGTSLATGAQQATAFGIGANWWLTNNFKLMCDFEKTTFAGGNYVTASGASSIPPEQVVFTRAQLIF